jgi:hypothetical protein
VCTKKLFVNIYIYFSAQREENVMKVLFMKKLVAKVATLFTAIVALTLLSVPVNSEIVERYGYRGDSGCFDVTYLCAGYLEENLKSDKLPTFRDMVAGLEGSNFNFRWFKKINDLENKYPIVTLDSYYKPGVLYIVHEFSEDVKKAMFANSK